MKCINFTIKQLWQIYIAIDTTRDDLIRVLKNRQVLTVNNIVDKRKKLSSNEQIDLRTIKRLGRIIKRLEVEI